jgi:hypothetical protein
MRTQIQPITIPTKPNGEFISLHIISYEIGGDKAQIGWDITSAENECVLSGDFLIDGEDFAQWGADDNYIINYTINKLNLQL